MGTLNNPDPKTRASILPHNAEAFYYPGFIPKPEADSLLEKLLRSADWQSETYRFYGKEVVTKRKIAFYGDSEVMYMYSGIEKNALPWLPELKNLNEQINQTFQTSFNSCLLNLYPDGNTGMGWHQDNEPELGKNPHIVSISLGDERPFKFRHKETGEIVKIKLGHGSLLYMGDQIQEFWQHELPKTKTSRLPRINLTFRQIYQKPF